MQRTRNKLVDLADAVSRVKDGATILSAGFGLAGTPLTLIKGLVEHSAAGGFTVVSNNCGRPGQGLGLLLTQNRIKRLIGTFFTPNPEVARYRDAGKVDVTLLPQGTFAEAIRAGGAGIPAFYTPTSVGTELAAGKETRVFDGREYVMERSIRGDVALIKAHKADELGNLTYRKTARNFNPVMATAADLVIAEVDEMVPVGSLRGEEIVTPHLFVDLLVQTTEFPGGPRR